MRRGRKGDHMRIVTAVYELLATLADWLRCGDLAGHLLAWLEVVKYGESW